MDHLPVELLCLIIAYLELVDVPIVACLSKTSLSAVLQCPWLCLNVRTAQFIGVLSNLPLECGARCATLQVGGDNGGDNPLMFRHGPRNWLQIRVPAAAFVKKTIDLPSYHLSKIYGGYTKSYPNPAISQIRVGEVGDGWIMSPYSLPRWDVYMPVLRQLAIIHCTHLSIIPYIESPTLEILRIEYCPLLKEVPGMDTFKALQRLRIRDCSSLRSISGLDTCSQLESVHIQGCSPMLTSPRMDMLTALTTLVLLGTSRIPEEFTLTHMVKLHSLTCNAMYDLNNQTLQNLQIEDVHASSIPSLADLRTLKTLTVKCPRLRTFPDLSNMTTMTRLELRDCIRLRNLPSLIRLSSLQKLCLVNCHPHLEPDVGEEVHVQYMDEVIVID